MGAKVTTAAVASMAATSVPSAAEALAGVARTVLSVLATAPAAAGELVMRVATTWMEAEVMVKDMSSALTPDPAVAARLILKSVSLKSETVPERTSVRLTVDSGGAVGAAVGAVVVAAGAPAVELPVCVCVGLAGLGDGGGVGGEGGGEGGLGT